MLLAGDLGGTKTIIGLFKPRRARPALIDSRTYRTLDYDRSRRAHGAVSP